MQNVVARGVEPCLGDRYGGGWALVGARRGPTPKRRTTRDEGCSVYDVSCPQGRLSKVLFLAPSAPLCYSPPIHSITISKTTALRFVLERQGLFLFSLLALPLFLTLRRERGEHFIAWLAALSERRAGLFVLLLPLALMRGVLGAAFSAYQGWTDFLSWFVFFVYGYLFVADRRFEQAVRKHGLFALGIGSASFLAIIVMMYGPGFLKSWESTPGYSLHYELAQLLLSITMWSWMIFALYIGIRFLNFDNPIIHYANEAVLPFYLLHFLMIVVISCLLVRWEMNIVARFLLVSTLALVATLGVYELLIKRVSVARWVFGMKSRKRKESHDVGSTM